MNEPGLQLRPVRIAGVAAFDAPLLAVLRTVTVTDSLSVPTCALAARSTSFSTAPSVRTRWPRMNMGLPRVLEERPAKVRAVEVKWDESDLVGTACEYRWHIAWPLK